MATETETELARLRGLPCWDVHWDCDTGLRLNFGAPHLDVREPTATEPESGIAGDHWTYRSVFVVGDWRLWVDGHWKLTLRDRTPVRSSSSLRQIEMGLARLEGQQLNSVEIDPRTGFTTFAFDLGGVLEVRRLDRSGDDELWELYTPDDLTLMVRGDGTYTSVRSSDCVEPEWRPLAEGLTGGSS